MSDTYPDPTSAPGVYTLNPGRLPNTDPGVDRNSSTQSVAFCPFCFYVQKIQNGWDCHRYAPTSQGGAVNWPTVQATDWCGEFRRAT